MFLQQNGTLILWHRQDQGDAARFFGLLEKNRRINPSLPAMQEKTGAALQDCESCHGPGQAHGLCFSVQPGVRPPPSLVNIFKELHDDLGCRVPNNGYLTPWAEQGVLLLNAVLTVRAGQPNSHKGKGWEKFTDAMLSAMITHLGAGR